jgi:hypothetical protein
VSDSPELPVFETKVAPTRLDIARGEVIQARVSHAYSGDGLLPAEARNLARSLDEAADRAEKLNAAVMPHLDAAREAAQALRKTQYCAPGSSFL